MPFEKGHVGYNNGKCLSEETRRKRSIAQKKSYENGRSPWFKGKHLTEEHKRAQSVAKKEYWSTHEHPFKERGLSQEQKDAISRANTDRKRSPETNQKISNIWKEKRRRRRSHKFNLYNTIRL